MFLQTSLFSKDSFGFTAQLCGSKLGSCPSSPEGKRCLIYSLRKSGVEWMTNPFLSPVSSSSTSQLPRQCQPGWGCCRLQAKPGLMGTGLITWMRWLGELQPPLSSWPDAGECHEQPRLWRSSAGPALPPGEKELGASPATLVGITGAQEVPDLKLLIPLHRHDLKQVPCHASAPYTEDILARHGDKSDLSLKYLKCPHQACCEDKDLWALTEPTPGSFLMTSAFILMPTSVWMWSVSSVQKSA